MEYDLGRATADEISALRQLLHRAVLHSGMQVAQAALHWDQRLQLALGPGLPVVQSNGKISEEHARN